MKQTTCTKQNQTSALQHIENMPRGTYLVDMDGVLFDYTTHLEKLWNDKYPNFAFDSREQTTFYTEDYLPSKYSFAEKDFFKSMIENIVDNDPDFFISLLPIESALEGIVKLAEKNQVYICTAPNVRNDYCAFGKIKSVRKYLGDEWVRRTIITKDKTLVRGDYLIDDKPEITGSFDRTWTHILYDQPYNRHINTEYRFNWKDGFLK